MKRGVRRLLRRLRRRARAFTLLEVLMAIAILGLGLSVVLGAQTGLFANAKRAERISLATGIARCRMSEIELELLQKGYPLIDQESEGDCCMGESSDGYRCAWKIQRIELPDSSGLDETDGGVGPEQGGALGALATLQETGAASLGESPDIGTLAETLGGAAAGGTDGLISLVLSFVYPSLKPMLEASIRKVVVTVSWQEGLRTRDIVVTQYVTDPRQGELDPGAADGLADGGVPFIGGSAPQSTPGGVNP